MTAEIINLRKARKAKARGESDVRAAENRVLFGRTKAEREAMKAEQDRARRTIEGHRIETARTDDTGDDR